MVGRQSQAFGGHRRARYGAPAGTGPENLVGGDLLAVGVDHLPDAGDEPLPVRGEPKLDNQVQALGDVHVRRRRIEAFRRLR